MSSLELQKLSYRLTVCKVKSVSDIDMDSEFFFIGKTDEEISRFAGQKILRKKRSSVMTDGEDSGYREFWIFR